MDRTQTKLGISSLAKLFFGRSEFSAEGNLPPLEQHRDPPLLKEDFSPSLRVPTEMKGRQALIVKGLWSETKAESVEGYLRPLKDLTGSELKPFSHALTLHLNHPEARIRLQTAELFLEFAKAEPIIGGIAKVALTLERDAEVRRVLQEIESQHRASHRVLTMNAVDRYQNMPSRTHFREFHLREFAHHIGDLDSYHVGGAISPKAYAHVLGALLVDTPAPLRDHALRVAFRHANHNGLEPTQREELLLSAVYILGSRTSYGFRAALTRELLPHRDLAEEAKPLFRRMADYESEYPDLRVAAQSALAYLDPTNASETERIFEILERGATEYQAERLLFQDWFSGIMFDVSDQVEAVYSSSNEGIAKGLSELMHLSGAEAIEFERNVQEILKRAVDQTTEGFEESSRRAIRVKYAQRTNEPDSLAVLLGKNIQQLIMNLKKHGLLEVMLRTATHMPAPSRNRISQKLLSIGSNGTETDYMRRAAMHAIPEFYPHSEEMIQSLFLFAKAEERPALQAKLCWCLGEIGLENRGLRPHILKLLTELEPYCTSPTSLRALHVARARVTNPSQSLIDRKRQASQRSEDLLGSSPRSVDRVFKDGESKAVAISQKAYQAFDAEDVHAIMRKLETP